MKKLILAFAVSSVFCAFADRTANQDWVARQITNAVDDLTANYQAGDVLVGGRVDSEQAARQSADGINAAGIAQVQQDLTNLVGQVQQNLNNEAASRSTADTLLSSQIAQEVTDRINGQNLLARDMTNKVNQAFLDHDFANSDWVVSSGDITYTEHPVQVNLAANATLSASGNWPTGKPVYIRVSPAGDYDVYGGIHYMGYGEWPTVPFHAVIWYAGDRWILNVLIQENN